MRTDLPRGTVTLVFTDIEGSTMLLHDLGAEAYADALSEHRRVLREAFARHGGVEVDTQGDAFFYAFADAREAVEAAEESREALRPGPIRVRVGIHTGTPHLGPEGYVGKDVHLGARIGAAGHGGQVLISEATLRAAGLTEEVLHDLGEHRLKDFERPIRILQLGAERHPPLKTISNTNLPRPASSFVGRQDETRRIVELIHDRAARIVTLTGPGGSGKTRLAIQAAAELIAGHKAGTFWVELAPIRDPGPRHRRDREDARRAGGPGRPHRRARDAPRPRQRRASDRRGTRARRARRDMPEPRDPRDEPGASPRPRRGRG